MNLQPGDILLWRVDPGAPLLDRLIGWAERRLGDQRSAAYYHVGFVSNATSLFYEAKPPRVCLAPIPNPLPPYVEVYRLRGSIDPTALRRVLDYADTRIGRLYDFLGVLTAGFIEVGGLEFCSQYTEDSFAAYPVELCPDVKFTTPDDVANSAMLVRVQP